jgi:hypothetical protein
MSKVFVLTALVLLGSISVAHSQEQQVYYPPYLAPSAITQQDLVARQNYILMQQNARLQDSHAYRSPGVLYQDLIPRHPGDYRDAYDRGEMPNMGGHSRKPTRVQFQ